MSESESGVTPPPASERERITTGALIIARQRHDDDCDAFSAATGALADGGQLVYCDACRQVLLRWGGA